ncbi:MAG TPA: hypothetical protein VG621_02505 [Candidatus Paceibacterota bacterium]|nr:hypothetical protein [Candidatus Paceibacterota bacterium]
MAHQQITQFYDIAKQAAGILCPDKRYEKIELLNDEKGIRVIADDKIDYRFTFSKNRIKVYIWKEEQKLTELSYVLGTTSVQVLVGEIRKALKPKNAFAALLEKF